MEYFAFKRFAIDLNELRISRKVTWRQVAVEANVNTATLNRIQCSRGKPDLVNFAKLIAWSNLNPLNYFWRDREANIDNIDLITGLIFSDKNLTEESATTLDRLVRAAYLVLKDG